MVDRFIRGCTSLPQDVLLEEGKGEGQEDVEQVEQAEISCTILSIYFDIAGRIEFPRFHFGITLSIIFCRHMDP